LEAVGVSVWPSWVTLESGVRVDDKDREVVAVRVVVGELDGVGAVERDVMEVGSVAEGDDVELVQ